MIRVLYNLKNKSKDQIREFVFRTSPYSEITIPKFLSLINKFLGDMDLIHMEALGEVDTVTDRTQTLQKYFMLWRDGVSGDKLYSGTAFVPDTEVTRGVNLRDYERRAEGLIV